MCACAIFFFTNISINVAKHEHMSLIVNEMTETKNTINKNINTYFFGECLELSKWSAD